MSISDQDRRVERIARERDRRRAQAERRTTRRALALKTGRAATMTPAEFSEITGVSLATVYRRIADNTLKHKKLVAKGGKKRGVILIYAAQLG
jgi:hypothetical protein